MQFLNTDNRITPAEPEFALWENAFIQDWFDKYTWTADGRITISGARTDTRSYLDISKTTQWKGNLKIILEKKTHVISWGLHVTKNLVCWSIRRNWSITTWNCKKRNDIRQWYKRSCPEAVSLISRKWLQDNFQGLYHLKGWPDPIHFIFEIIVGKSRIRHRTTPDFWWFLISLSKCLKIDRLWHYWNSGSFNVGSDIFRHCLQKKWNGLGVDYP